MTPPLLPVFIGGPADLQPVPHFADGTYLHTYTGDGEGITYRRATLHIGPELVDAYVWAETTTVVERERIKARMERDRA